MAAAVCQCSPEEQPEEQRDAQQAHERDDVGDGEDPVQALVLLVVQGFGLRDVRTRDRPRPPPRHVESGPTGPGCARVARCPVSNRSVACGTSRDLAPLAQVIAPPYDVIIVDRTGAPGLPSPRQRRAGRAARGRPHRRAGPLRRGHRPLHPLASEGILVADPEPSLYPYRMTDTDGPHHHRRDRAARPGRPPGEESDILPHEQTLPKPKSDRLDLLRATRANLSPIWGLSMADGRHRHVRPDRRRTGGRRLRRRRGAPPAVGARRPRHDRRGHRGRRTGPRSCWPTATTATRRRGRTKRSAARPTATWPGPYDLVMALVVELSEDQLTVGAIHRTVRGLPEDFDLVGRSRPVVRRGARR